MGVREIIFRGKRVDNGEWYYGYLLQPNIISNVVSGQLAYADLFVDENTVGQYTGLKDKNGKKIFDGDIVKDIAGGVYKVVYDTEYMRFAFEQDSIKWGLEGFVIITDFEVIGNIYDNPELLKQFD